MCFKETFLSVQENSLLKGGSGATPGWPAAHSEVPWTRSARTPLFPERSGPARWCARNPAQTRDTVSDSSNSLSLTLAAILPHRHVAPILQMRKKRLWVSCPVSLNRAWIKQYVCLQRPQSLHHVKPPRISAVNSNVGGGRRQRCKHLLPPVTVSEVCEDSEGHLMAGAAEGSDPRAGSWGDQSSVCRSPGKQLDSASQLSFPQLRSLDQTLEGPGQL